MVRHHGLICHLLKQMLLSCFLIKHCVLFWIRLDLHACKSRKKSYWISEFLYSKGEIIYVSNSGILIRKSNLKLHWLYCDFSFTHNSKVHFSHKMIFHKRLYHICMCANKSLCLKWKTRLFQKQASLRTFLKYLCTEYTSYPKMNVFHSLPETSPICKIVYKTIWKCSKYPFLNHLFPTQ